MQQVVDLQNSKDFQTLGVQLLSISPDSVQAWAKAASANRVATAYGVMRWGMSDGAMPGHTFVLVDRTGRISWIRDYGAPEHGGLMYVTPKDLVPLVAAHVGRS